MKKTTTSLTFSEESLQFLKLAGEQTNANWLEENDIEYQRLIRGPLMELADSVKKELEPEAPGYHFPSRALGRIKKASHKVERDGAHFKDWVSFIVTRPSLSRFEKNPLLFFGLLPNDKSWQGVVVAGGLYMASSHQTRCVRQAISDDPEPFKKLFADKEFKRSFKNGFNPMAMAKNCPRGFDADHPDIDWIKLKTFFVSKNLKAKEFSSQDLAKNLANDFRQLLRLNEILDNAIER